VTNRKRGAIFEFAAAPSKDKAVSFLKLAAFPLGRKFSTSGRLLTWGKAKVSMLSTEDARAGLISVDAAGAQGRRFEGPGMLGLGESEVFFRIRYGAPVSTFGEYLGYRGLIAWLPGGKAKALWLFEPADLPTRPKGKEKKVAQASRETPVETTPDQTVITVPDAPASGKPAAKSPSPAPSSTPAPAETLLTPPAPPQPPPVEPASPAPERTTVRAEETPEETDEFSMDDEGETPAPRAAKKPSKSMAPAKGSGTITGDEVRIRKGPGKDFKVLGFLNKGDKVKLHEASGDWRRVTTPEGKKGWVHADYVKSAE